MKRRWTAWLLALVLLCSGVLPVTVRAVQEEPMVLQTSRSGINTTRYYYDENGSCVRKEGKNTGTYTEYAYNEAGTLVTQRSYVNYKLTGWTEYDDYGHKAAVWIVDQNGKPVKELEYTPRYDSFGRLLFHDGKDLTSNNAYTTSFRYEYYSEPETVVFGHYEQDNDVSNGPEPIEWEILDTDGDRILLLSKYALDSQYYYETDIPVSWGRSDLRGWLNANFLYDAFTEAQQTQILPVTLEKNAGADQLFLLSLDEVNRYFADNTERLCKATDYALAQNAYVSPTTGGSWWLLRTPGKTDQHVMSVNSDGSIDREGGTVSSIRGGVRPAMWVNVTALNISTDTADRIHENCYYTDQSTGERVYLTSNLYTYNDAGKLSCLQDYITGSMTSWTYDDFGNPTEEVILSESHDAASMETKVYRNTYENGQLVEVQLHTTYEILSDPSIPKEEYEDVFLYAYDQEGRMISQESRYSTGSTTKETWSYDAHGNLLKFTRNGKAEKVNTYVPLRQALWEE